MASVLAQIPFNEHLANGATTVFAYEFQLLSAADMVVRLNGAVVPPSSYTLSGVGNQAGGSVTFLVAPANLTRVLLSREMELSRDTDYQYNGDLREATLDRDLNRIWLVLQEVQSQIECAVRAPYPYQVDTLPGNPADYAGYGLGINSAGQPTYVVTATPPTLPGGSGYAVQATTYGTLHNVISLSDPDFVAKVAENTATLQAAIDTTSAAYLGGAFGGGAGVVEIPAGFFYYNGLIHKRGVRLRGQGSSSTILALRGASSVGIRNPSSLSGLAADQLENIGIQGIAFVSGESAPVAQVMWDAIGYSKTQITDCYFEWFGGCSAVTVLNSVLAGSGGPACWYNEITSCYFVRRAARPAGGVGLQLGDTDLGKEQITTWTFTGGWISGSGDASGLQLRGTGNRFFGVTFEGMDTAVDVGSAGTRGGTGNVFCGCYWEGNTINRLVRANAVNTTFIGSFITGGADSDLSASTLGLEPGNFRAYLANSAAGRIEFAMENGANYRPKFKGSTLPGYDVENSSGNYHTQMNAAVSSTTWSWVQWYAVNRTVLLAEMGQGGFRFGSDNAMSLGSASFRASVVYAGTGTINTSDIREKQDIRPLSVAEHAVAMRIKARMKAYRWRAAVAEKGPAARIHFGAMAQEVAEDFVAEGLDPSQYALFCYDSWEAKEAVYESWEAEEAEYKTVIDGPGAAPRTYLTKPARPAGSALISPAVQAGDRFGLRYDELLCFLMAAL